MQAQEPKPKYAGLRNEILDKYISISFLEKHGVVVYLVA